jgi:YVTN family beta-propeller protein
MNRLVLAAGVAFLASLTPILADDTPPAPTAPVNIYAHTGPNDLSPATAGALSRVYVPNSTSHWVHVIDPATDKVVDKYRVGMFPQHVVPSWDLKTLWVTNNASGTRKGSLTPIDPLTGKPGKPVPVNDPYNMYFMPDGSSAIVVAENDRALELRDPQTMALKSTIEVPGCDGINHADFSADDSYAIFTCEFGTGGLAKIDLKTDTVVGYLRLADMSMPQDIRLSPDGKVFYVADMMNDGVFMVDGDSFTKIGFIPTGVGTHGFVVSRDGTRLYVSNRGSHDPDHAKPRGPGSVSIIDFASRTMIGRWDIPGGGSPDMGNVSIDGKHLWFSGRFDAEVYDIDTDTGAVKKIPAGPGPHGLTVWPQPGRYSQGHTGNMR